MKLTKFWLLLAPFIHQTLSQQRIGSRKVDPTSHVKQVRDSSQLNLPTLYTQADFDRWQQEVNRAVIAIENSNNGTSRNFITDYFTTVISGFFTEAVGHLKCEACKVGVGAATKVAQWSFTKGPILAAFAKICPLATSYPKSVCEGIASTNGPLVFDIISHLNLDNKYTTAMACNAFGDLCPTPDILTAPLTLPPPTNPTTTPAMKLNVTEKYKYILQFSDLHFDPDYLEGSEADCDKVVCCQKDSNSDLKDPTVIKRKANKFGDYKCDNSKLMTQSILKSAASLNINYDMVLFTGDVPPHTLWKETLNSVQNVETLAFNMLETNFKPSVNKLYPSIGNHESLPVNAFPLDSNLNSKDFFLYKFLAKLWSDWLPTQQLNAISKSGYYSVQHTPTLKVIMLNMNLCYKYNFYLLLEPTNPDPNGMLKWLVEELYQAEKSGSKVYLTGHVPPGSIDCYPHWSTKFTQIINRFKDVVIEQFYGHLHYDEFQLFYNSKDQSTANLISNAYIAPSMTTHGGMNPGFRVYKVDPLTYQVLDFDQYYADLSKSNTWTEDKVPFEILYSAKQTFGTKSNLTAIVDQDSKLDKKFWHDVVKTFEPDNSLAFQKFYKFRTKGADTLPSCDKTCKSKLICSLKAGNSKFNCLDLEIPF